MIWGENGPYDDTNMFIVIILSRSLYDPRNTSNHSDVT